MGRYEEGTYLANEAWGGNGGISDRPSMEDSYQPAGDFYFSLDQGEITNYKRELNLERARVKVTYDSDGKNISRTVIGHLIEDCIIVRIYAREEKISGTFWLDRKEDPRCDTSFDLGNATIIMHGAFHRGSNLCKSGFETAG